MRLKIYVAVPDLELPRILYISELSAIGEDALTFPLDIAIY